MRHKRMKPTVKSSFFAILLMASVALVGCRITGGSAGLGGSNSGSGSGRVRFRGRPIHHRRSSHRADWNRHGY